MLEQPLAGKKIAILIGNGFEELHMTDSHRALVAAGATVRLVGLKKGVINGWHGNTWGHYFQTDTEIGSMLAADFDMLVLPGGKRSIDKLRETAHTRRVISGFMDGRKPVAALSHGIELLAFADRVRGRTLTGAPESKDAVIAAGAKWRDDALVTDGNLLTTPGGDMPNFVEAMLDLFTATTKVQEAA
jgi:putative intracellular protease/amidase